MEGRSAAVAGLISGADMARRLFLLWAKEKPRPRRPWLDYFRVKAWRSVALAKQLQQQREQVDEVQVERQCAGNRRALSHVTALRGIAVDVVVLQPLGVPGGEARKYQDADDRHHELQHRAGEEDIDQARDDDAEQAHDQERTHAAHVTPRGVAVEAQGTERGRSDEE